MTILIFLGYRLAALGVALGVLLFATNLFLMKEIARAILRGSDSGRPKLVAASSSSGRLLFLAISLSVIAVFLGRLTVVGACGGLLMSQVNLHILRRRANGEER